MKYLLLLACAISFGAFADTNGTVTSTDTRNTQEVVIAPNFIQPLSIGGGDVFPMNSVLTATSANCPQNQVILALVNTSSGLRGSGAPSIGNYGIAAGIKAVFAFGDGGRCERHGELIHRNAKIDHARNVHNLCMGSGASFKAANPDVYFDDDFFENNESYVPCREIYTKVFGMAHRIQ